jgi:hypothetical protein
MESLLTNTIILLNGMRIVGVHVTGPGIWLGRTVQFPKLKTASDQSACILKLKSPSVLQPDWPKGPTHQSACIFRADAARPDHRAGLHH